MLEPDEDEAIIDEDGKCCCIHLEGQRTQQLYSSCLALFSGGPQVTSHLPSLSR